MKPWVMAWNAGVSRHDTELEALAAADAAVAGGARTAVVWEDVPPTVHRAVWTEPGAWWPSHRDFDDAVTAHAFAAEKAREIGDGVGVHDLGIAPATSGGTR